jgi:hypothetical protein
MITKTLRTSGGDFSTLQSVATYLTGTPPTDDVTVRVQAGQTFIYGGTLVLGVDCGSFQVIFETDPTDDIASLGMAAVNNDNDDTLSSRCSNFNVNILWRNIIWAKSLAGDEVFGSNGGDGGNWTWRFENVVMMARCSGGQGLLCHSTPINISGGGVYSLYINNCHILIWRTIPSAIANSHTPINVPDGMNNWQFTNNVIIEFGSTTRSSGTVMRGTSCICHSNSLQSFSGSGQSISSQGTDTSNLGGTIGYATQLIQNSDEAFSTVIARIRAGNHNATGSEGLILDNANATYAAATDYFGTIRPQGLADDRGSFELLVISNTPPEIEIDSILVVA